MRQGPLKVLTSGLATACALAGCAVHPRPRAPHVDRRVGLAQVRAHPRSTRGVRVRWGGMVVSDQIGPTHSTLTILAYPLNAQGRPLLRRMPLGRFQAVSHGYLDPILFAQGRLVTIVGTAAGTRPGLIGQAHYLYPRLHVLATHIWRLYPPRRRSPWRFGFGIGIGL